MTSEVLVPDVGVRVPDRQEPKAYWLVCDNEDPEVRTLVLVRPEGEPPGPEMTWPINRWRAFLDRHAGFQGDAGG